MSDRSSLLTDILIDEGAPFKAVAVLDCLVLKLCLETGTLVRVRKSEATPETFSVEVRGPKGWWAYASGVEQEVEAVSICDALAKRHGLLQVRW